MRYLEGLHSRLLAHCYVLYVKSLNHGYICIGKVFTFYLVTFHRRTILGKFLPENDTWQLFTEGRYLVTLLGRKILGNCSPEEDTKAWRLTRRGKPGSTGRAQGSLEP